MEQARSKEQPFTSENLEIFGAVTYQCIHIAHHFISVVKTLQAYVQHLRSRNTTQPKGNKTNHRRYECDAR
jgi:hypothetical protein